MAAQSQSISGSALSSRQIARAAAVVLVGFLASGILGLVRTATFNALFGTSAELEAFYAAQRIPELLFTLVAGGALGSSFIPVFSRLQTRGDTDGGWRLASAVMTFSALAAGGLGLLLAVAAPLYMPLLYSRAVYQTVAIQMTQMMLVTTVIFSISGLLMGILNSHQNFLLPALALSMNNLGLIAGAVLIAPLLSTTTGMFAYPAVQPLAGAHLLPDVYAVAGYFAPKAVNIYGLALGAILGASLHLAIQLFGLRRIGARLRVLPNLRVEGVGQVLRLMLPRMLGLAVAQINFMVNTAFATTMVVGSLTVLNNAWFLMFFALGVIAQSMGTAVFPSLSALAAANDLPGFRERLAGAMRAVLFLALPVTVGFLVLGEPLVAVLFERGVFTPEATAGTAWALAFFAMGIAGHSLLEVLSRAFYALADTRTPVTVGIAAMIANIVLNVVFIQVIGVPGTLARGPFAGLALANSLTTLVEAAILWVLLRRRIHSLNDAHILNGALRALVAALVMGAVIWLVSTVLADQGALLLLIIGGGGGVVSFFGLALLLRIDEAHTIPGVILGRLRR